MKDEPTKPQELVMLLGKMQRKWEEVLDDEGIDGMWYAIDITIHDMRQDDNNQMVKCAKASYSDVDK